MGSILAEIQVEESFQTVQTAQSPSEETIHAVSTGSAVVQSKSAGSNVFSSHFFFIQIDKELESGEYFAKQGERQHKKSESHEAKLEKNTEVSLQRKKAKQEKDFRPPEEKSAKPKEKKNVEETSKLVKNMKKKVKRLQND